MYRETDSVNIVSNRFNSNRIELQMQEQFFHLQFDEQYMRARFLSTVFQPLWEYMLLCERRDL